MEGGEAGRGGPQHRPVQRHRDSGTATLVPVHLAGGYEKDLQGVWDKGQRGTWAPRAGGVAGAARIQPHPGEKEAVGALLKKLVEEGLGGDERAVGQMAALTWLYRLAGLGWGCEREGWDAKEPGLLAAPPYTVPEDLAENRREAAGRLESGIADGMVAPQHQAGAPAAILYSKLRRWQDRQEFAGKGRPHAMDTARMIMGSPYWPRPTGPHGQAYRRWIIPPRGSRTARCTCGTTRSGGRRRGVSRWCGRLWNVRRRWSLGRSLLWR